MRFDLTDDQRMLRDSVDRLIAERFPFEERRRIAACPEGWSREAWAAFAELGLTMLTIPEDLGGLGLGGVEAMIVGEAFGRGLVTEPYLPSIVLAATAIIRGAAPDTAATLLADIASGETIAAYAHGAVVTAVRDGDGDGWRVDGEARVVPGGDAADLLLVPAGDALYAVRAEAAGVARRGFRLHGGGTAADVAFAQVSVPAAMRLDGADAAVRAVEAGIAFLAAEAVGAMQAALDLTVDYLGTRIQFGRPIGTNQALQHRAAEMLVELEQARSAAIYAAVLLSDEDAHERARGFAAIKAVVGKAGRVVAQGAVQLHGGIGVSEEHAVSHYFRRLTAIDMLLGDGDTHIDHLARLGGFTTPEPHGTGATAPGATL